MSISQWMDFKVNGDERGELVALEELRTIPFNIKRVYYMFNMQADVPRGFHAHKEIVQVVVCVKGSCRMVLHDGQRQEEVWLDSPKKGLIVGVNLWHEMHDFSHDCVLMVLASDYYDESDYIRDFDEFIKRETNA